jgi:hypothetical protein
MNKTFKNFLSNPWTCNLLNNPYSGKTYQIHCLKSISSNNIAFYFRTDTVKRAVKKNNEIK